MTIVRWAGAAAVVCSLHMGGAILALMYWPEQEADDTVGAMTVEMELQPSAARVETRELAHGPLTPAVLPQPEASEKLQEEEVVEDLPTVAPSLAPEPEIALPNVPQEEKRKKPQKEQPRQVAPEKQMSWQAAEQQVAMAPPRVEAPPAQKASDGQSATVALLKARWVKAVNRHLERFRDYPQAARRRGQQGTVRVRFRVDRSGHLVSAEILKASGAALLDEDALAWLKRGSPIPLPPDQLPETELELVGNMRFELE
jgi:protein TonB